MYKRQVCGLHQLLSEDSELAAIAEKNGAKIHDIRKPKKAEDLRFWTGEIKQIQIPKIAVLGERTVQQEKEPHVSFWSML